MTMVPAQDVKAGKRVTVREGTLPAWHGVIVDVDWKDRMALVQSHPCSVWVQIHALHVPTVARRSAPKVNLRKDDEYVTRDSVCREALRNMRDVQFVTCADGLTYEARVELSIGGLGLVALRK